MRFFPLLIRLDATRFAWLNVFTLIETICPKLFPKSRLKSAKTPLPVDVRRSKTWLSCAQALLIGRARRCSQTKTSLLKFPHLSSSKTNQLIRDTRESREERKKERFSSVPPPPPHPLSASPLLLLICIIINELAFSIFQFPIIHSVCPPNFA